MSEPDTLPEEPVASVPASTPTGPWHNRIYGLVVAALIFVFDQAMKFYVVEGLGLRNRGDHHDLLPFFDFTRENNYGVSLGMFQATSMEMRWFLLFLTGAIALVVLVWMLRERLMGDIAALALVLGGALGNIVDRYKYGYVVDFLDFHIGDFRPFLIFNVADAAITIGVVLILARTLFMREKPPSEHETATADTPRGEMH